MDNDDEPLHFDAKAARCRYENMDEEFCVRMRQAIEAGLERAPMGSTKHPMNFHTARRANAAN